MEMLQGVWKQYLRPRTAVGYAVKILLPSPPNYVTRSPGKWLIVTFWYSKWQSSLNTSCCHSEFYLFHLSFVLYLSLVLERVLFNCNGSHLCFSFRS